MLHSLVLKLRTEAAIELPRTHGHQAHALFLRLVQAADPVLAKTLHDPQVRKPFTVSGVQAPAARVGENVQVGPGRAAWVRVTLLDETLFAPFMERFLRAGSPVLRLGPATLGVEEVIGTAEGHPLAGFADFDRILGTAGDDHQIALEFRSPTAFSLGRAPGGKNRMGVLPEPGWVFDSLLRKWNQFAPSDLALGPRLRRGVEESCVVLQHELRTAMFRFPRHLQIGFVGRCRFGMLTDDGDLLRATNALAAFALYAGVGYKTTMGMGQAWRAADASRPDGAARRESST